jgi:hypothetical protein
VRIFIHSFKHAVAILANVGTRVQRHQSPNAVIRITLTECGFAYKSLARSLVFAVNSRQTEICGRKEYPTFGDIADKVDLAGEATSERSP